MKTVLICLLTLLPLSAFAQKPVETTSEYFPQQMSARNLLTTCASSAMTSTGRERRRYCWGFVSGVEETMRHMKLRHSLKMTACVPAGVSAKALADVFIRFAANRQSDLDLPAAALVRQALINAYPCERASDP